MLIKNALLYEDGTFTEGKDLMTAGEVFAEQSGDAEVLDAEGGYCIPGLVDIHFHGSNGADLCDGSLESLEKIASYELKNGITSINPATMTLPPERLLEISRAAAAFAARQKAEPERLTREAELAGLYMEGPFISAEKIGAQNPGFIKVPDPEILERLQEAAGGLYTICTVAPEAAGAMDFIRNVSRKMRVSLAHTAANFDTATEAFEAGARQVTHLYNAMKPYTHREPGLIGAACDQEEVSAELICDGIHLHPCTIRTTFKMFGDRRIILISDSMMAAGMADGSYELGGQAVTVRGNLAVLDPGGAIAGSVTNLFNCMRYAVQQAGIPLASAVRCATENPAKAIGIWDRTGSLETGKYADFLILDQQLRLKYVVKKGQICQL